MESMYFSCDEIEHLYYSICHDLTLEDEIMVDLLYSPLNSQSNRNTK